MKSNESLDSLSCGLSGFKGIGMSEVNQEYPSISASFENYMK